MRQSEAHGEYADEQLTTIQKRIYLIEFLIMVGLFVCQGGEKNPSVFPILSLVRKLGGKSIACFTNLRTFIWIDTNCLIKHLNHS